MTRGKGPNGEKVVAILQSNYIPWKGYFDIIAASDVFVIFDDVQFTRRDWRNRNKILLNGEARWLTIPVASKGAFEAPVHSIEVPDGSWAGKHLASLRHAYSRAPHARWLLPKLEELYAQAQHLRLLTQINELFLVGLAEMLGLEPRFTRSDAVPRHSNDPTARLVEICVAHQAELYVSGPAAKAYIDNAQFAASGIGLAYANYAGYPSYDQGSAQFEPGVSVLDLLFRVGPDAAKHLKATRQDGSFLEITA